MKLYFENAVTTVTTLMILALLGYISWSAAHRAAIQHWGCRSLFLLAFGLAVCCCAAARDGLDKTIQQAIDGSCAPGLFQLVSVPTIVGCIGALVIVIAAIATPIQIRYDCRQYHCEEQERRGQFLRCAVFGQSCAVQRRLSASDAACGRAL